MSKAALRFRETSSVDWTEVRRVEYIVKCLTHEQSQLSEDGDGKQIEGDVKFEDYRDIRARDVIKIGIEEFWNTRYSEFEIGR